MSKEEPTTAATPTEGQPAEAAPAVESAAPEAEAVPPSPDSSVPETTGELKNGYYWGTGRRKSSVARVRIRPGKGEFVINKRSIEVYFCHARDRNDIVAPLETTHASKHVDVFVNVGGGGTTGQAGAIVLGLARALCKMSSEYEGTLREGNFLTRDSREVERKKYGQRGARRRFQFSKR